MSPITRPQTGRQLIMVTALLLCIGLGVFLVPQQYQTELWADMAPHFPQLSALLTAGGVMLLLATRFRLRPWLRRITFTVPVGGLAWLTIYLSVQGEPLLALMLGLIGAGTVVACLLGDDAACQPAGPDLALAVVGLMHSVSGGLMLFAPQFLGPVLGQALNGQMTSLGLSGLLGGGVLLARFLRWRPTRVGEPVWWLAGALFPGLVGLALLPSAPGEAVTFWVVTAAIFTVPGHLSRTAAIANDPSRMLEQAMEMLSWLLAFLVVAATALGEGVVPHFEGSLFVLLITAYSLLLQWGPRLWISVRWRVRAHLLFYPMAIGVLLIHPGHVAPVYFVGLLAMPIVTGYWLGRSAGLWNLGAALAVMVGAGFLEYRETGGGITEFLMHTGFTVLASGAVAGFMVLRAAEHARMAWQNRIREGELKESEERFRSAFDYAPNGMALVALDGRLLKVNSALCHTLGYCESELLGSKLLDYHPPEDLPALLQGIQPLLEGRNSHFEVESRYIHHDGRTLYMLSHAALVCDAMGKPKHLIVQIMDITDRKELERALAFAADHDALTALQNRRGFARELVDNLTQVGNRGALILLDLDQFKFVNDSLGHKAGDEQLKATALLLSDLVGNQGVLGRLGGDEFAILLPGFGRSEAGAFAARAVKAIRTHSVVISGNPIANSASLGVVLYPEHGRTAEELIALADMAMFRAKESGRNRFHIWQPGEGLDPLGRLNWERRIRTALEEERFCLHAQPIMDLSIGRVNRYELLIRMIEPDGRILLPGAFLSQAERFGLIASIDRWVAARAIEVIAEMERAGAALPLEINLSGQSVTDPDLLAFLQRRLQESGINPAHLVIEITETSAITDMKQAHHFVEALKVWGCQFAIDDFGAGFSSFNYLKRLSVNYLKIDGSLVQGLADDPVNQNLVRAIAEMARTMGKQSVAEYVEDEATLELLRSYGVDFAQGYHIGRPQPLELELLAAVRAAGD